MSRFDLATEAFKNFDATHGLQTNEFNLGASYQSASGEMFFGGVNGFNAFHPNRVRGDVYPPPVVLTQILESNEPIDVGRPPWEVSDITFSDRDYMVGFEFSALSFTAPKKNRLLHQLEGFDPDWIDSSKTRQATYSFLPPGEYVFRVKGANSDGVWNENGVTLRVHVVQASQSWWRAVMRWIVGRAKDALNFYRSLATWQKILLWSVLILGVFGLWLFVPSKRASWSMPDLLASDVPRWKVGEHLGKVITTSFRKRKARFDTHEDIPGALPIPRSIRKEETPEADEEAEAVLPLDATSEMEVKEVASPQTPAEITVATGIRVFLCHAKEDKEAVRIIYHRLKKEGFKPWLDEEDLLAGQHWRSEIQKAVRACDAVVVCLSQSAADKSGYVQKEIRLALDSLDEKPEGSIYLLPVKLEECRIPDRLEGLHVIEIAGDTGFGRLVRALRARATQVARG